VPYAARPAAPDYGAPGGRGYGRMQMPAYATAPPAYATEPPAYTTPRIPAYAPTRPAGYPPAATPGYGPSPVPGYVYPGQGYRPAYGTGGLY
jgi:hypothetical protein